MAKIFNEFYFTQTNRIHEVEEINNYVSNNDGSYSPYQGKMRCPECYQAELSYTHKTTRSRAYLSRIPSSQHKKECSYNFSYATNKEVSKYFENLSPNQIENKLSSMINFLCQENRPKSIANLISNVDQHPMVVNVQDNPKIGTRRVLKRKKLSGYIDKSFGNDLHIFYGKVKLSCEEKNGKDSSGKLYKYYILTLKTLNKNNEWKFRATIYRGSIKDEIDENLIYNIAIIGNLDFSYKYLTIKLVNKNALKYKML